MGYGCEIARTAPMLALMPSEEGKASATTQRNERALVPTQVEDCDLVVPVRVSPDTEVEALVEDGGSCWRVTRMDTTATRGAAIAVTAWEALGLGRADEARRGSTRLVGCWTVSFALEMMLLPDNCSQNACRSMNYRRSHACQSNGSPGPVIARRSAQRRSGRRGSRRHTEMV